MATLIAYIIAPPKVAAVALSRDAWSALWTDYVIYAMAPDLGLVAAVGRLSFGCACALHTRGCAFLIVRRDTRPPTGERA